MTKNTVPAFVLEEERSGSWIVRRASFNSFAWNALKRMESSVASFALTVQRQLADVGRLLARIEDRADELEEIDIADIDIEDPAFESLLVGRKVKVLLQDVDPVRWRQDLIEDRNRLATLHASARQVTADRDAKLAELRETIGRKCCDPINIGNRKVIVFTAFADTANYLYEALAPWASDCLGSAIRARHRSRA